jgi:phosphoadenosine phosphosulfate reductase
MFRCGFTAEDMVVLDLIGRYRFPIKVITVDEGMAAAEAARLRAFVARRYVFATPVVDVHDDRRPDRHIPISDRNRDWLAVVFAGCRAWVTGARRADETHGPGVELLRWDAACECMRCNVLAHWQAADVRAYLQRWEIPCGSADGALQAIRAA